MTRESMLQHLRLQGEETISRLWREAETRIREQRALAERTLAEQREQAATEFSARLDLLGRTGQMEARQQADRRRVTAHNQLAARLKELAVANLATLRSMDYDRVFALLVDELPKGVEWEGVTVHPDDRGLAAAALPRASITTDSAITGGLAVTAREGRVRIVNTFDKRLERAWPEILAVLLHELASAGERDDNPAP